MRLLSLSAILVCLLAWSAFGQMPVIKDQAAVGNVAPDFTATSLRGKTVSLADFKGKVVVMNFWSTKCAACEYETEALNNLVETFKGKDVVFLGFAHDGQPRIEQFLKKKPFKYEIFPASMQTMITLYGKPQANGFYDMPFPLHIVVNQQGVVEINETGLAGVNAVQQKLESIFKIQVPAKPQTVRTK